VSQLAARGGEKRCGISAQPAETEAGGTGVRLDQTHSRSAADQVSRTEAGALDVSAGGSSMEPGTHASPAGASDVVTAQECVSEAKRQASKTEMGPTPPNSHSEDGT